MSGPAFDADKRKVHQLIASFTKGELSEDWLKPVASRQDGREDMKALKRHFAGEGNATRRIAVAERLRETLHYRNERALSFEVFLSKVQKMFNIFEKQKEEMTEEAKVRFLLKKCLAPGLKESVAALKTRISTAPAGTVTFTMAANHLASCVSELPEYVAKNRNISLMKMAPSSGIKRGDGSIHTGFFPNWRSLSKEERDQVSAERRRNKGGKAGGQKSMKTELQSLKKRVGKTKRQIAALKTKVLTGGLKADGDEDDDDTDGSDDAGDCFGGKRQKKPKTDKK